MAFFKLLLFRLWLDSVFCEKACYVTALLFNIVLIKNTKMAILLKASRPVSKAYTS